jgi:hypothetical protein
MRWSGNIGWGFGTLMQVDDAYMRLEYKAMKAGSASGEGGVMQACEGE